MPLSESIRQRIIYLYCTFFLFVLLFKYFNHGFLYQLDPAFFFNRLDFSTWLIQLTGLHQLMINNNSLCLIADIIYAVLPFIFLFTFLQKRNWSVGVAVSLFIFNFIYAIIVCMFSLNALEQLVPFILFPLIFIPLSLNSFWFLFQALRYFFLFYFASAGVWKFVQGGIFNLQQMSGILIVQHKDLLVNASGSFWQLNLYSWLIEKPMIGYMLYLISALLELLFIIGFFTKRLDKWLIIIYLLFLIMDAVIMRIHYWETLPFIITLLYSNFALPSNYLEKRVLTR
jgi:hypothetical protein